MTLEEAFAEARATFPNYPEEIFHLWLHDRIKNNGWPPTGPEWAGFLFGHTVSTWQSFIWHKEQICLRPDELTPTAFSTLLQLVDAGVNGRKNAMTEYIANTVERFTSCIDYIKLNGTTPGAVLLLRGPQGYDVVDGNHRVAALLAVQSQIDLHEAAPPIQAWVATQDSSHRTMALPIGGASATTI